MSAGERLREIRNKLDLTMRDVEQHSRRVADLEGNEEFFLSYSWLAALENSSSVPSIFKLYSLSVIYRVNYLDLLLLYGVDLNKIGERQLSTRLTNTHLTDLSIYDERREITFPVRFDPGFSLANTSLLSRMVESWAEVPIALLQQFNLPRSLFGYIGLSDRTLYPLVRPGSLVQIDSTQRKVVNSLGWHSEYERPIYFVELRDGYACGWCEIQGREIFLIPHQLSNCAICHYAYPQDAEVVGRVTAVAVRLVPGGGNRAGRRRDPEQS